MKYFKSENEKKSTNLYTKEYIIKEDHLDFNNELIKFDNVELSEGVIKIYILLNQKIIESNNSLIPNYFSIKLNQMKTINNYVDIAWNYINDIKLRLKFKITIEENKKNSTNTKIITKKEDSNLKTGSTSIKDRVKYLSSKTTETGLLRSELNDNKEAPKKLKINPNLLDKEGKFRMITSKDKMSIIQKTDRVNYTYNNKKEIQKYFHGELGEDNKEIKKKHVQKLKISETQKKNEKIEKNNFLNSKTKKLNDQKQATALTSVLQSLQNPKSHYEQELKQMKKDNTPIKVQKIPLGTKIKNFMGNFSPQNQKMTKQVSGEIPPLKNKLDKEEKNNNMPDIINSDIKQNKTEKKMNYGNRNYSTGVKTVKRVFKDKYNIANSPDHYKEIKEKQREYYKKEYCYLEPINYAEHLQHLIIAKNKIERETFCEGFFIASFPLSGGEVIENSQSFPSPCGHQECSTFPAMKPEIIMRYPLNDTENLELNNLAATICFPTGIKVCYSEEDPTNIIDDYLTSMTNQKGERYYMMTYHFYQKISNNEYTKKYEMHPLKNHLMKFGDSYLTLSDEGFTEKIIKKVQETLEFCQELGFRDYVYVPFCLCLISKYPYAYEMTKCLQSIFNVILEEKNLSSISKNFKINDLIMYLINSIPIPIEKYTRVEFYIPFYDKGIAIECPKIDDINIVNINYLRLIELFSIDNIIIIIRLLLLEKKILFIDDDYTRLSEVTDAFRSLLYPFRWIHTYIPIMSDQMLKYLEAFLPFLNGIHSSLLPLVSNVFNSGEIDETEDVFLLNNKEGKISLSSSFQKKKKKLSKYLQSNVPELPYSIEKKLRSKLTEIKDSFNGVSKHLIKRYSGMVSPVDYTQYDINIRDAFIQMFIDMFKDYPKYMCFLDGDVVFNKNSFMKSVDKHDKTFYNEFLDTQIFQVFTQSIFNGECDYFNKLIKMEENEKNEFSGIPLDVKVEKIYIIPPLYLGTNEKDNKSIEAFISNHYPKNIDNNIDNNNIFLPSQRVINSIIEINNDNYKNDKCLVYTLPVQIRVSMRKSLLRDSSAKIFESIKSNNYNKDEMEIYKKTSSNLGFVDELNEKEKDDMKEIIKDYLRNIFTSTKIEYKDPKIKSEILNILKKSFCREFFVSLLSSNLKNIVLLQPNSFVFLGFLIYNVIVEILNVAETNKLLTELYLLIKSSMYFGIELKGKTKTVFQALKSKIKDYPKFNQKNFWYIWYQKEMRIKKDNGDSTKQKIILNICSKMLELEKDKIIIKDIIDDLNNKAFGDKSEMGSQTQKMYMKKITDAKYTLKDKK